MRLHADHILLSATDLNTFLGCSHASALDYRRVILAEPLEPLAEDEAQRLVQRRGLEHEHGYFEALRAAAPGEVVWGFRIGLSIMRLPLRRKQSDEEHP